MRDAGPAHRAHPDQRAERWQQDGSPERAQRLARGFTLLLVFVYGLIVLGALVRAHGAGLACPDWPLCFGELLPRFDFHVAFEWGHRLAAGSVALVFLALARRVARDPALRAVVGRLVLVAALLLATQVVLGGLTVLHLLASWSVTAHLVTGNAFALTLFWVVLRLREYAAGDTASPPPVSLPQRGLVLAAAALLGLQMVLGGLVSSRYAGLACPDWPACDGGVFFPTFEGAVGLQLVHRLNGYALAAAILLMAWSARGTRGLARPAALALGLVVAQIGVGAANVWLRIPVEITALHSAGAAALVLAMTACVRAAWRRPPSGRREAPAGRPRVVIVGAGFGGLAAVRALARAPVDVLLIDRNNYHAFLPLLYQVATSGLTSQDIAHPVRAILRDVPNARFRLADVLGADLSARQLEIADGEPIPYDVLVIAAGSATESYGNDGVAKHAFGLHDVEEAVRLRNHVLGCLERAEAATDPAVRERALGFVVVGGGPTGVETAGALAELRRHVVPHDFPRLAGSMRVVLLEGRDALLAGMPPRLQERALAQIRSLGVDVRFGAQVETVDPDGVRLRSGELLPARTVVWAAGVRGAALAERLGLAEGRAGRIPVGPTLEHVRHRDVYVIGDLAQVEGAERLPLVAPVAMQQGSLAAQNVLRRMQGSEALPFVYRDRGAMATIGRNRAVAHVFGLALSGRLAWWAWLLVHIVFLVGFRNRVSVFWSWVWNYLTYDRGLRAMVGPGSAAHGIR